MTRAPQHTPGGAEHVIAGLKSGCGGGMIESGMSSLLSFLGAAVESRQYRAHTRELEIDPDGNEGLFEPAIVDWATENADELGMVQCELEGGGE